MVKWDDRDEVPEWWADNDDDLPPWVDKMGWGLCVVAIVGLFLIAIRIGMQGVG